MDVTPIPHPPYEWDENKRQDTLSLTPNPPMDRDGRGEDAGRGRGSNRRDGPGSNSGRWGVGDGLQALLGTRWRPTVGVVSERRDRTRARCARGPDLARVGGDVGGTGGRAPSGWEWNGSQQPGQGATELGFPRPALWQMQGEAACRAG